MAWLVQQDGTSFIVQQDGTSRLVLNDTATATPVARRITPAPVDTGSVELRGVVRLGIVIAATTAAFVPALRVVPAQLSDGAPELRGRITVGYRPPTPVAIRLTSPVTVDDAQRGVIRTAAVISAPSVPVVAVRVTPAWAFDFATALSPPGQIRSVSLAGAPVVVPDESGGVTVETAVRYIEVRMLGGTIP